MNKIDLYVNEVGERLPSKMRADIEAEIRSSIEDTLEGRSQETGRAVDDEMIVEVLKEFGAPSRMAASYLPPRYLIGPRFYPIFMLVLRIVISVIVVVGLVRLGVAVSAPGLSVNQITTEVGNNLAQIITSLLSALGNIVFIFAILEWALPKVEPKGETNWDPRTLTPRPEHERIQPAALIWGIIFTTAAILIFNIYPQWIGFGYLQDGHWHWYPILSQAFFRLMPLLTIAWALQIILDIILLRQGGWHAATRWFQVGIKVLGLVILGMMISGPSIIDTTVLHVALPLDAFRNLEALAASGFRALLIFVMVLDGAEIVKMLVRLFEKPAVPLVAG